MLLDGDSLSPDFPEAELWPLLARWVKPGEVKLWRAAAYRFHGLVAERWRSGRTLLAGDSAHMTPPFMAQGMVQGIRDAQNLAWKLARVLQDESPDALLDSYDQERIPHVKATTSAAIALGRVICERDPERARARDARLLAEHGGQIRTTLRQNMIPDLQSGVLATQTPGAGSLFPQPWVIRNGADPVLLDDLTGPTVRVVVLDALTHPQAVAIEAALGMADARLVALGQPHAGLPDSVLQVQEHSAVVAPWLTQLGMRVALVRPDHYVFGTAATVDGALALITRLRAQLSCTA